MGASGEKDMKRIYVAGSYSSTDYVEIFENMRNGMRVAVEVYLAGYAPFTPWHDHHHFFMLREGEKITLENMYTFSLAWLEASDAILVLPNSENSKGTQAEIVRAKELGIPVFYDLENLKKHFSKEVKNESKIKKSH
jgi:hypothetical protein